MADKQLVSFDMGDGKSIAVEVDAYGDDDRRATRDGQPEEAQERFNEVIGRIRPVAQTIFESLQGLDAPDEIGLEMGIKLSASAGIVLASADSEATFKVSLKWKNS